MTEGMDATMAKSLVAARKAMDSVTKGSTNPAFKSRYADLSAVLEAIVGPLLENGIFLSLPLHNSDDGKVGSHVHLIHESGSEFHSPAFYVPVGKNDAQGYGGAGTYVRRYVSTAFFGIPQEDDDGNTAVASGARPQVDKPTEAKNGHATAEPAKLATPEQQERVNILREKLSLARIDCSAFTVKQYTDAMKDMTEQLAAKNK